SLLPCLCSCSLCFSTALATPALYTLSLHDALPICRTTRAQRCRNGPRKRLKPETLPCVFASRDSPNATARSKYSAISTSTSATRSEEHTSELQSRVDLVCRLLLEKKKTDESYIAHQ